jgi:hypothetical protein
MAEQELNPLDLGDRDGAVVVAYVVDKQVTSSWHHCMIELVGWDMTHAGRVMRGGYIAMKYGTDGLVEARQKTVKMFLEEGRADWLFWVDTDMGFAPDTVDRLMAVADPVDHPMVGGLCFTQREESSDGMGGYRCRATPTVFDWTALPDGEMGFSVRWNYPPDTLTRVAGTGSACVLIHRSVFERIEAAYGPIWYERVTNTTLGQVMSEDLSMCLRAGALDIPIHIHTGVKTSHAKTLWLAEDDYFGQVALSRIPPAVPPAAEPVAVIVPTLGRPASAAPFMESLKASGCGDLARVYAVANPGPDSDAWLEAGAIIVPWNGPPPGTYAQRVNLAYAHTDEPWLFLAADDVRFHPGWLDQAEWAARDGACVVGTNDLHNPRVTGGDHATHMLIRRAYIDEQGASWDGPGVAVHEGYAHNFTDDEIVQVAKDRDVWVPALHAKVEHLHPLWKLAPVDATYELGAESFEQDRAEFLARRAEHGVKAPAGA